jgi:hypothetical protein
LISKKNIRYEGILYSINEADATVALQNVKSYGTEGRENLNPETQFVAPQEGIHAYLMFRGCDIKDLHVHEQPDASEASKSAPVETAAAAPKQQKKPPAAKAPRKAPPASDLPPPPQKSQAGIVPVGTKTGATTVAAAVSGEASVKDKENQYGCTSGAKLSSKRGRGDMQVGTGASLLNRTARGTVQGGMSNFCGIDKLRG